MVTGHGQHDALLNELTDDLRQLHAQAGHPSLRRMAATAHYSHTALAGVLAGGRLPSLDLTLGFVRACGGDERIWRQRWIRVRAQLGGCLPGKQMPTLSARDPGSIGGTGQRTVPAQVPHDVRDFTGRAGELARLRTLCTGADREADQVMPIAAITGPPGVGKTVLAIHFAHQIAHLFPDGQLWLDLHGFGPEEARMQPRQSLPVLLRSLGLAPSLVPVSPDEQAACYRTLAAGRRLLLVLDNAADEQQVRPLLPGSPESAVLVTSRSTLSGLVARDGASRLTNIAWWRRFSAPTGHPWAYLAGVACSS